MIQKVQSMFEILNLMVGYYKTIKNHKSEVQLFVENKI